jgi:hypothetical protein
MFIFQIIPTVRCRPNYTIQVSKLRLLKIKLLPAGPGSLSDIIRGCWWSYFNSRTMLTLKVCAEMYAVHPESTRGEVTRIRYPVTRITYLKTFCVKPINLVYSLDVSHLSHFSAREIVDPRILNAEPHYILWPWPRSLAEKKVFVSDPESWCKRQVCSRASKWGIERGPY